MGKKQYKKLDSELIREITEFVIDRFKREEELYRQELRDKRLRNTKLLLRNYRELLAHSNSAVYDASLIQDEDVFDILDRMSRGITDDCYVESIKRSAARTRIIIEHVTEMLQLYELYCERSPKPEDARRYRIVYEMYIAEVPKTTSQLAAEECIDERTVYRDIDVACEKLSALIFGIDALKR